MANMDPKQLNLMSITMEIDQDLYTANLQGVEFPHPKYHSK